MKKSLSQSDEIAIYLNRGKKITPIDALDLFGCFRLAARIHDLRGRGMNIKVEDRKDDDGKRYASYFLGVE